MSTPGLKVVEWSTQSAEQRVALLRRPASATPGLQAAVADIIAQVRGDGDAALGRLTQQFDGVVPESFEISAGMLQRAGESIGPRLAGAIGDARERIRAFHAADLPGDRTVETAAGLTCTVTYRPLSTVGLYVPGGTAPLISTVLMLATPAQLAGCDQVVMCSPPGRDGRIAEEILAAAGLCGVNRVFCVGGAHAVAAMAYGTATVPRCFKILLECLGDHRQAAGFPGSEGAAIVCRPDPPVWSLPMQALAKQAGPSSSPGTCCRKPSTAPTRRWCC
jgi:histidinol dehydrogenase